MKLAGPMAWARARSPVEWLALAAGLAVFGYLGWDSALWDARLQLALHLVAIGAILALGVVALRGEHLPRTPLDLPLLGLLAAFALATLGALNVGMSLRAVAAITAYACMLPIALLALRYRPSWVGVVTSVPVLLIAIPTLGALVARRVEWAVVGAPGLPPLRLPSEGTPFGSVAVPPFVLVPAWVLAGLIEPPLLRRAVRTGLVAVGIPLVILSGSRSAWLGLAVGSIIAAAPWAWQRRHRLTRPGRLTGRSVLLGLVFLSIVAVGTAVVAPRLTAVGSLLYRGALWRDTLAAWISDPLTGIGPGFMPYARQAAAADYSFPVRQPHSHNLPLGVLGDSGLVGLAAALTLIGVLCLVGGPWRTRTPIGRASSVVLIGLGVAGLFEDLTFLPNFNLLVITLVAVALLDGGGVTWAPARLGSTLRRWSFLAGAGVSAAVLTGAMVVADAAGIAYRAGIDRAEASDWEGATSFLARAVEIDRWHPAGPRALAVAATKSGNGALALQGAGQATLLNPGDATAWVNLALLCLENGDAACARDASEHAIVTARYQAPELLYAAIVLDRLGHRERADEAYRLSLLTQPATAFMVDWPRRVVIGDGTLPNVTDAAWQLSLLVARHASGESIAPSQFEDPAVRALAHASIGERDEAEAWLARALSEQPHDSRTFEIGIILREAWGEPIEEMIRIASTVRGKPLPERDRGEEEPGTVYDIGSFRGYPHGELVSSTIELDTTPPFPWALQAILP